MNVCGQTVSLLCGEKKRTGLNDAFVKLSGSSMLSEVHIIWIQFLRLFLPSARSPFKLSPSFFFFCSDR